MRCSYNCNQVAQVKCNCALPYMCHTHFGSHILEAGNHPYEAINIDLGSSRLIKLRSSIMRRIQKINLAKNEISLTTKTLINRIENMYKKVLNRLETINNIYFDLLRRDKFTGSEMETIENIESREIVVQTIDIDEIQSGIQSEYEQELVKYMDKAEYTKIKFLEHHNGGFFCGCITTDGKILVTGGSDSTIRVWNLIKKRQMFVLHGHLSSVNCVTLTGDSKHIISGSKDASVRIWNLKEKKQVAVLREHRCIVNAVYFVDAKSLIISGGFDRILIIWDFKKHIAIQKISLKDKVYSLALILNQPKIIAGLDPDVVFYEIESGTLIKTMKGHSGPVKSITLTTDEKKMVTGSSDKTIIIWDLISFQKISQLEGHSDKIYCLALTSDEKLILSGSIDYTMRIWDMQTGSEINQYKQSFFVNSILRVNNSFISLSQDASMGQLDMEKGDFQVSWLLKRFDVDSVSFSADDKLIAYGSQSEAAVWELDQDKCVLAGHKNEVKFVKISRDGSFAISGASISGDNLIYWDLKEYKKVAVLRGHTGGVFCGDFSEDSLSAATGSYDKTVRTWNLRNYMQDFEFKGHNESIYSIKFIDKKNLLASGGYDKTVIIWRLSDKTQYAILQGHNYHVKKVLATDDGRFVVSCDLFEGIRVWNVDEKRQEYSFEFQEQALNWLNQNKVQLESIKRFLKE